MGANVLMTRGSKTVDSLCDLYSFIFSILHSLFFSDDFSDGKQWQFLPLWFKLWFKLWCKAGRRDIVKADLINLRDN